MGKYSHDVFISYRRLPPDELFAHDLYHKLSRSGITAVIDQINFSPSLPFVSEMERCIRICRFTVCVISPRYIERPNTLEEALICKTNDLQQGKRSLIPLILEKTNNIPLWLSCYTSIDFTSSGKSNFDPFSRLVDTIADYNKNSIETDSNYTSTANESSDPVSPSSSTYIDNNSGIAIGTISGDVKVISNADLKK